MAGRPARFRPHGIPPARAIFQEAAMTKIGWTERLIAMGAQEESP